MAGHSHSANIRFRKDRVDAKRAKMFAKLSRALTVAARHGGGSIEGNPRLRMVVEKARLLSMPKENIDRAIRKGTGEGAIGDYEEIAYEGYGPGGVALLLDILTDNRHRTAADVRMVFEKFGGNLGGSGTVAWMFERRARFVLDGGAVQGDDERLLELVVEVGAEDFERDGDAVVLLAPAAAFAEVQRRLAARGIGPREAGLANVPAQRSTVADAGVARALLRLIDALEDNDDVQAVWSNEYFPPEVARILEG